MLTAEKTILLLMFGQAAVLIGILRLIYPHNRSMLSQAITVNTVIASLFGMRALEPFGFTMNIGAVFYISTVLMSFVLAERFGINHAIRAISNIILAMGLVLFSSQVLKHGSPLHSGEPTNQLDAALDLLSGIIATTTFAQMIIFVFGQLLVYSIVREQRGSMVWRYVLVMLLTNGLDSTLYYSFVYLNASSADTFVEVWLTGFLAKLLFTITMLPLIHHLAHQHKHECRRHSLTAKQRQAQAQAQAMPQKRTAAAREATTVTCPAMAVCPVGSLAMVAKARHANSTDTGNIVTG